MSFWQLNFVCEDFKCLSLKTFKQPKEVKYLLNIFQANKIIKNTKTEEKKGIFPSIQENQGVENQIS